MVCYAPNGTPAHLVLERFYAPTITAGNQELKLCRTAYLVSLDLADGENRSSEGFIEYLCHGQIDGRGAAHDAFIARKRADSGVAGPVPNCKEPEENEKTEKR